MKFCASLLKGVFQLIQDGSNITPHSGEGEGQVYKLNQAEIIEDSEKKFKVKIHFKVLDILIHEWKNILSPSYK